MNKKKLIYISLVLALVSSLLPTVGIPSKYHYLGIPAQTVAYYGGWHFNFNPLGLFVNFLICYILIKLAIKFWHFLTVKTNN